MRWFLSVERKDLPYTAIPGSKTTHRSITIDGSEVEFSEGFTDLHTRIYEKVLAGEGYGIATARPAIELVHSVRTAPITAGGTEAHPMLTGALK